jgi:plasmid maintenance system antidote protein VapI
MSKAQPSLADQLRTVMKKSRMTTNAVAVAAGIPQPVLHRFVTGERDLTLETADKLARYFKLRLRPNDGKKDHLPPRKV